MLELACSFDALAKSVICRYLLYSFVVMIVHTQLRSKKLKIPTERAAISKTRFS